MGSMCNSEFYSNILVGEDDSLVKAAFRTIPTSAYTSSCDYNILAGVGQCSLFLKLFLATIKVDSDHT